VVRFSLNNEKRTIFIFMAKGQKKLQNEASANAQQAQASTVAAETRLASDPLAEQRRIRIAARRKAITDGNVRDAPEFMSNAANVAERQRMRGLRTSLAPTGAAALGAAYASPEALASQNAVLNDSFDRDASAQAESDYRDYSANVNSTILGNASQRSLSWQQIAAQIAAQRASVVPGLIGAGLGAGGSALSGYLQARRP